VLLAERCLSLLPWADGATRLGLLIASALTGVIGGQTAVMHLGRPLGAWRAWIGWRTSWLSREIVAFGLYGGLILLAVLSAWSGPAWRQGVGWLAVAVGGVAVYSSARFSAASEGAGGEARRTMARFGATLAALGLAGALAAEACAGRAVSPLSYGLWLALFLISGLRLRLDRELNFPANEDETPADPLGRTGRLLQGRLRFIARQQRAGLLLSGLLGPGLAFLGYETPGLVAVVAFFALATRAWSEICERLLFFQAEAAPRMPGGLDG
jgi:DMSO reductase anchor subunit